MLAGQPPLPTLPTRCCSRALPLCFGKQASGCRVAAVHHAGAAVDARAGSAPARAPGCHRKTVNAPAVCVRTLLPILHIRIYDFHRLTPRLFPLHATPYTPSVAKTIHSRLRKSAKWGSDKCSTACAGVDEVDALAHVAGPERAPHCQPTSAASPVRAARPPAAAAALFLMSCKPTS